MFQQTSGSSDCQINKFSDEKIFGLAKRYGKNARFWRQKFIGLLPEVNRRRLYERKGFSSIFEFGFKLCGLSEAQVRLAINLEKKFEDLPELRKILTNGGVSINKLVRVASIANNQNEIELAEKVRLLPQKALETLVRDEKILRDDVNMFFEDKDVLQKPLFDDKSLRAQRLHFEFSDEVIQKLNDLNEKGIDVNQFMSDALSAREQKIEEAKMELSEVVKSENSEAGSRYLPTKIKDVLNQEFGTKCSITTCSKPFKQIHHVQRFGLISTHDPKFLAPLCVEHHQIAHSIDIKYQEVTRRKQSG